MNLPDIPYKNLKREQEIVTFRGLNRTENVRDGDLKNAVNLSTKSFPCITQRGKRTAVTGYTAPDDIFEWDGHLLVVDGGVLYYDGSAIANVTNGKKQWAVVNTQLCVWPDMIVVDLKEHTAEPIAPVHVNSGTATFGTNTLTLQSLGGLLGERQTTTTYREDHSTGAFYTFADKPTYTNGAFDLTGNTGTNTTNADRWFIPVITEGQGGSTYSNPPDSTSPVGNEDGVVGYVKSVSWNWTSDTRATLTWTFQYFDLANGAVTALSDAFAVDDIVNITGTLFGVMDVEQAKITALDDATWKLTFDKDFPNKSIYSYYECTEALAAGKYYRTGGYGSGAFIVPQALPAGTVLLFKQSRSTAYAWDPTEKKLIGTYAENETLSGATSLTATVYSNDNVAFTLQKNMPVLDYICESDNRLWGVSNKDKTIYASALGLPGNFYDFDGLDTDSYSVPVGSEGDFTAICAFGNGVCCWKSHMLHKIVGSNPSEYYMNDYRIEGVADHRSMSIVNETLYYNGVNGVYAFGGGVPALIGYELGGRITDATGGTDGLRWYLSGTYNGAKELLVYDLTHRLWTREDAIDATAFALVGKTLYMLAGNIYKLEQGNDATLAWSAELVTITENSRKLVSTVKRYYQRLVLRLDMAADSSVTVQVREDFGDWRTVLSASTTREVLKDVNMPAKRCDRFDVKISGTGKVTIRDLTRVFVRGSER